ncbi:MAG: calcium/sodium antiporter [Chloroflexota bacterium]
MHLIQSLIILIIAFYFLAKIVDEIFIKSLDNISDYLKLPPSVSGATFMAAGTSAPELSTTLFALFLAGASPATGLGTVVGSAIFQILVVIGFAATIKTSYLNWKPVIRDGVLYCISILLLIWVIYDGAITFFESSVLVFTYFLYLIVLAFWARLVDESQEPNVTEVFEEGRSQGQEKEKTILQRIMYVLDTPFRLLPDVEKDKRWTIPIFILSLASIAFACYFLVIGGEAFALAIGVPPSIVALTILAGGSSVPEMIGSAIVSRQGRGDMAISNAIGSNVFDILISLGLPLMIFTGLNGTLDASDSANITSSVFLLFATMVMVLLLLASQRFKVSRPFGIFLIAVYVVYVIAAYNGIL